MPPVKELILFIGDPIGEQQHLDGCKRDKQLVYLYYSVQVPHAKGFQIAGVDEQNQINDHYKHYLHVG